MAHLQKRHKQIFIKPVKRLIKPASRKKPTYAFQREAFLSDEGHAQEVCQIRNLINYTKTSGSPYDATKFPAGYQTINIEGLNLKGKRDPQARLKDVPFDFTGKTVLDMGSNQGGMLFALADKIKSGVGVDYDHRMVNVANRIADYANHGHINFYVLNLEKEDLALIEDLLPSQKVDIVFLLAVCAWVKNWRDVIGAAAHISDNLLFESNGVPEQQESQIEELKRQFKTVQLIRQNSVDDPEHQNRSLYFCVK